MAVTTEKDFIPVFRSVDLARRKIPLIIQRSPKPGPSVWVAAAIHGDEVTGTETVLRLNRFLGRGGLKRGTVYTIPVMNPMGYELVSRYEPIESVDLNRCFPGNPKGSTAERIADKILSEIVSTKPSLVIDLHTDSMESIPYVDLDQVLNRKDAPLKKKLLKFAEASGINYFVEDHRTYGALSKTMTAALVNIYKIPAFTFELGGPLVVKDRFVEIGLHAVKNLLGHLKMIDADTPPWVYSHKIPLKGLYETVRYQYTPDYSGIVEYRIQPGAVVKKGQVLARIKDMFNKTIQTIRAREEAVVISYADQSICFPGTELFMLARRNDRAFRFGFSKTGPTWIF